MLDSMSPEQMDDWMASYSLDPWGFDATEIRELHASIYNAAIMIAGVTSGAGVKADDFVSGDDFRLDGKSEQRKTLSDEESEQWAAQRYGKG